MHHEGPVLAAVAPPKLNPSRLVAGGKEEGAIDVGEPIRGRTMGTRVMSLTRTVPFSEVTLPQLLAIDPISRGEEQGSVQFVSCRGFDPFGPSLMSFTRWVPAAVPSVIQSRRRNPRSAL